MGQDGDDLHQGLPEIVSQDAFDHALIAYHFWFPPGGAPCGGCSMFTDQLPKLAHLNARDVTYVALTAAPPAEVAPWRERFGWQQVPFFTSPPAFRELRGTTEYFSLDVFLREGDRVFLTYETRSRGVEALGSVWTFLDRVPFGRQETWEDTPDGRPQSAAYGWWGYNDSYDA